MPVATKKLRSNRAWIERHINDPFVKRSKAEGYRARSVYKLTELDDREHLLRRGMTVVDLGAAPGSWTQSASVSSAATARWTAASSPWTFCRWTRSTASPSCRATSASRRSPTSSPKFSAETRSTWC